MINFLQKNILPHKTHRFKDNEFDLDLSYITDRIIAMSFPGSGLETIYRNSLGDVARCLEKRHGKNYLVFNLSGITYDYSKFNHNVRNFGWEDHHSPPLDLVFDACYEIQEYLKKDPANVVVIHCLAGKGRTGTIIVSYLLYSGRLNSSDEALEYYRRKRFAEKGGVTQPSQVRAVKYFEKIFNSYLYLNKQFETTIVQVDKITLHGVPNIWGGFKPVIKIHRLRDRKVVYDSSAWKKAMEYDSEKVSKVEIELTPFSPPVAGDIIIKFSQVGTVNTNKIFFFAFNTSFLDVDDSENASLRFDLKNLDPYDVQKDKRFPLSFTVDVHFKILQKEKDPNNPTSSKMQSIHEQSDLAWEKIYSILKQYKSPSKQESCNLLFFSKESDDVEKVLGKELKEDARAGADFDLIDEY